MSVSGSEDARRRAWWFQRQALPFGMTGASPAQVLERSGWARSVGGSNPYLTLYSRAQIGREEADAAAKSLQIHELPCARGCTYVVPAVDFAMALKVGQPDGDSPEIKQGKKYFELTDQELDRLCGKILDTLGDEPMDPTEIKSAVGDAVRNLGPEGKKRGLTTTLPMALGKLQLLGEIRRSPVGGRLDNQRYGYVLWKDGPFKRKTVSSEEAFIQLANRYFKWIGPTEAASFSWFSGLGMKATLQVLTEAGIVPISSGSDLFILPEDREAYLDFSVPAEPSYSLVSVIDAMTTHRRNIRTLLAEEDLGQRMQGIEGLFELGKVVDLTNNAILDRGRLIGLWEYDPTSQSIAWTAFVPVSTELKEAIAKTESFIRGQLGDARSFSLDSPASRLPKIQALRANQPA